MAAQKRGRSSGDAAGHGDSFIRTAEHVALRVSELKPGQLLTCQQVFKVLEPDAGGRVELQQLPAEPGDPYQPSHTSHVSPTLVVREYQATRPRFRQIVTRTVLDELLAANTGGRLMEVVFRKAPEDLTQARTRELVPAAAAALAGRWQAARDLLLERVRYGPWRRMAGRLMGLRKDGRAVMYELLKGVAGTDTQERTVDLRSLVAVRINSVEYVTAEGLKQMPEDMLPTGMTATEYHALTGIPAKPADGGRRE